MPEIVTITCPATGDRARVLVSLGFNCFDYRVNVAGETIDVLWALPDYEGGQQRPSSSGIPILFPFPGRIPGTSFTWEGKTYQIEAGDAFGNAIHGFCYKRPWRVIARQDDMVTGEFHAAQDDPTLLHAWPGDFRITATYALGAGVLSATYKLENPGDRPLPCGFGSHPYFRLPLGGDAREDCVVTVPVKQAWELEGKLTTGRLLDSEDAGRLSAGVRFGDLNVDAAFDGLAFENGWFRATIDDPNSGRRLSVEWDDQCTKAVVFTPPHREAICIEPYSCIPNAITLAQQGINCGLRILAPGESVLARMMIRIK